MPGRIAYGTYSHDLGRRHPFEVSMLGAAAVVGGSRVLTEPTSGSLETALSPWLVSIWYVLLSIGALIALSGVFWRSNIVVGLRMEQSGLIMLTSAGSIYGGALVSSAGWRGLAAAAFLFGFSAACGFRTFDIGRILSRIRTLALSKEAVLNGED